MRTRTIGCTLALMATGVLLSTAAHAQTTGRITGVVTAAEAGRPLYRVQVSVEGTQLGALTDSLGRYRINNVPAGTRVVRATSLGFAPGADTVRLAAGGEATANFQLATVATALQGVVTIGYGTQRKDEITSSIVSVSAEQFNEGPVRDAAQLIAGKVAGVGITTSSGNPTGNSQISLRGVTTVNGSTNPLILIDGVPGDLETVPAPDIESISILKDGSAAAIYGSRASNGVILVTTKRHSGSKPTIRYDGFAAQQRLYRRPDFLNANDYRRLKAEGYAFEDFGGSTDWQTQILRQPISQRHNVTISGGTPGTNYNGSLTYDNAEGVFIRSDNREVTARGNLRHTMFDGKLDADVTFLNRQQDFFTGADWGWAWRQALIRNPTDNVRTEAGAWQERGTYMYNNPVGLIQETNGKFEGRDTRLYGTVNIRPIESVRFTLLGGVNREQTLNGVATTFDHVNTTFSAQNGTASRATSSGTDRIFEGTGTYTNSFGRNNVTALAGYSYQDFVDENFSVGTFGFPTDLFGYDAIARGNALAEGRATLNSGKSDYKVIGFFGRLNYDWNNRYLLNLTVRQEGNSRFGAGNKWGTFPAVSGAWRISEEGFAQRFGFLDDLKVRVGYGVTGIAPTGSYQSLTSYNYLGSSNRFLYNGQWVLGLQPARNPNPNLRWEEKHEVNTGVDFALFNSRLSGAVDVYRRETRDMIYNYAVPVPPYLFGSINMNVGTMRNDGVEGQLSFDVLRGRNLRWTTSANLSRNSNRLVSLSNDQFRTADCFFPGGTGEPIQSTTHRVCVGRPIGEIYGHRSVDIDDNGEWIVLDSLNQQIPIRRARANDRQVLGNGIPKMFGAFNNNVRYRNFDLDLVMRGAFQFQIVNYQRMYYENPKIVSYNMLRSAFDPVYGKRPVNYDLVFVSHYVENGDFMKLDNLTLGYTLGQRVLGALGGNVSNARLYLSGRNLLVITGYKGMDPEVGTSGLAPGSDQRDQYPTTRTFTAGMTVTF